MSSNKSKIFYDNLNNKRQICSRFNVHSSLLFIYYIKGCNKLHLIASINNYEIIRQTIHNQIIAILNYLKITAINHLNELALTDARHFFASASCRAFIVSVCF